MKWQGRERSSNIEDRRGQSGGGIGRSGGFGMPGGMRIPTGRAGGGGLGLIGIIVVLGIIWFATGQNPLDMLTGGNSTGTTTGQQYAPPPANAGQDELSEFVGVVVKDTENLWTEVFAQNNLTYQPPTVVLFTDATQSGCGVAQAASGPFYCPNDKKVYIDLSFYDQLRQQFGAPGDFAQAYVIAHEIGHAVQDQTGVLPQFNRERASMSQDRAERLFGARRAAGRLLCRRVGQLCEAAKLPRVRRHRGGDHRGQRDRRRYADARAGQLAQLHARHLGAAHGVAQARHAERRREPVRHVQREHLGGRRCPAGLKD